MIVAVVAVATVIGLGLLARVWFAPPDKSSHTFAGAFTPETQLSVRNLTILGGRVRLAYSFDVLLEHPDDRATLRCGLIDTSGTLEFFESSRTNAPEGAWTHLEYAANFDLPELTLGIRCSPSDGAVMSVVFRDVALTADVIK